ncbi:hypothetical protein [Lewinella cohaerens]|uniref:hypothetical protein n=1 Tax=Lewinella cohaerens TaxID=70995 RepID=UPI0003AA1ACF|nr:hypothetical protein [Lewinella cohaerens]
MQDSKLIQILKTFSDDDWAAIRLMASSPYYISGREAEKVQRLIELLHLAQPDFNAQYLDKALIAKKIYPETRENNVKQLPKLMSRLMRLIEAFFIHQQQIPPNKATQQRLLAAAFEARGLKVLAAQKLNTAGKQLSKESSKGKAFYWEHLQLAEAWFTHFSSTSLKKSTWYLHETEQKLDEWYLLSKLEQVVWQKAQSIHTNAETTEILLPIEGLLNDIATLDFGKYPVHGVYYHALLFLLNYHEAKLELFQEVAHQLQLHSHLMEEKKVKALQTLLRIFATGRYNHGEQAYLSISFHLYQAHLAAGYLHFDGKIHSQTLLNMVTIGLRMKAFEWVTQLLKANKSRILDLASAPNAYRFNQALLSFYQGNLEEALSFLDDTYHNIYYKLAARRLEIMIYYEQQSVLLDAKMEAFKVYIFRLSQNQLPIKPKTLNNSFIDILRQIAHPKTLGNDDRITKIRNRIKTTAHIAEREWLLDKLA